MGKCQHSQSFETRNCKGKTNIQKLDRIFKRKMFTQNNKQKIPQTYKILFIYLKKTKIPLTQFTKKYVIQEEK